MRTLIDVLLVESDRAKLRKYASMSLWRELGFRVKETACTAAEALSAIGRGECRLLVAVSRPPEVSAEVLLKYCGDMAAIVMLPRNGGESVGRYFALGACDVIAEPPSRSRLRRSLMKVSRILGKGEAAEEYRRAAERAFAALETTDTRFVSKLRAFIEQSEGETATTGSAAEYFRFNRDYFGKLFKQETGMSFNRFYNRFRMEYAKELLTAGSLRVCEISELLGFSSVDYFTGVFRRETGCTPSVYRESCGI